MPIVFLNLSKIGKELGVIDFSFVFLIRAIKSNEGKKVLPKEMKMNFCCFQFREMNDPNKEVKQKHMNIFVFMNGFVFLNYFMRKTNQTEHTGF